MTDEVEISAEMLEALLTEIANRLVAAMMAELRGQANEIAAALANGATEVVQKHLMAAAERIAATVEGAETSEPTLQ